MRNRPLNRVTDQRAISLVEVMVALMIMATGLLTSLAAFASSKHTTADAERKQVAGALAERELEAVRNLSYDKVGLTALPQDMTETNAHPVFVFFGTTFVTTKIDVGNPDCPLYGHCAEAAAGNWTNGGVPDATLEPRTTGVTVPNGSNPTTATVYRFVSWRREKCADSSCDARSTKRVLIAVVLDRQGYQVAGRPPQVTWVSTVIADPTAGPAANTPPPALGRTTETSQFLYASRCGGTWDQNATAGNDSYPGAPGATDTHDTANWGTFNSSDPSPANWVNPFPWTSEAFGGSFCETSTHALRPDLMGNATPSTTAGAPLPEYSTDPQLARDGGGLQMRKLDRNCTLPSAGDRSSLPSYNKSDDWLRDPATFNKPNRFNTHSWSSKRITTKTLHLRRDMSVNLYASGLNGSAGDVTFCFTLLDRQLDATNKVSDVPLAAGTGASDDSCKSVGGALTATMLSCRLQLADASPDRRLDPDGLPYWKVSGDGTHRLVLIVQVTRAPANAVVLGYDNSSYPSFAEFSCDPSFCPIRRP